MADLEAGVTDPALNGSQTDVYVADQADEQRVNTVKSRRRQLRGKITRAINRVREMVKLSSTNRRRIQNESSDIRNDYASVCNLHCELYDLVPESEHSKLDKWEAELSNDLYTFEEDVEDYLSNLSREHDGSQGQQPPGVDVTAYSMPQTRSMRATTSDVLPTDPLSTVPSPRVVGPHTEPPPPAETVGVDASLGVHISPPPSQPTTETLSTVGNATEQITPPKDSQSCLSFDDWIDRLVEFVETKPSTRSTVGEMSVADALYRLEASKDIPNVKLTMFDGNPLSYVEFIETFKLHVHDKQHLTDNVRMVQLKMHLSGEAEKAIAGLGSGGVMYATALKILKDQFGQKSVIARAFINKTVKGPKISSNNRQGLRDLSLDVINCLATLNRMSYLADVNSVETLRQVVRRFPDYLIPRWKAAVTDIRDRGGVPTLDHISNFLRKHVRSIFDPDFGDIEGLGQNRSDQRSGNNRDSRKGIHSTQAKPGRRTMKCYICEDGHSVTECPTFADSSVSERVELVKINRLCFSCLIKGHLSKDCRSKKRCDRNGCTKMHHPLLHTDPRRASCTTSALDKDGIMPVVRARFRAVSGQVREGNILIDSGAGTTIIRKDFAKSLGLQGRHEALELSVVGGERLDQKDSRRVKFWVSPISGGEEFEIEAHEINKTVISVPPLDRQWLATFPHLSDLSFSHKAGPIDLILGVQYSHLHAESEIRQGLPFQPLGKRSRLGWFVIGTDNNKTSSVCSLNFVQKIDLSILYDLETLGVRAPQCTCSPTSISGDDRKALEILEKTCHKQGNRYTIGLPWKIDPLLLPNNHFLAERRLYSLERSLLKNSNKAEMYTNAVDEYLNNGWAVKVSKQELASDIRPVYYLPHHGVVREDKPSTPLRVVFDPACPFKGVWMNSFLFKGPCLIGNLLGVLLRFREDSVAFVGDISKIFLQILLNERDSHVHRFLWRCLDTSSEPTTYRLTRVTFGDRPSPDMASFVMLKLAETFEGNFPEEANILRNDRYVDDLIHSCDRPEEAVRRMKNLNSVLADGSFSIKEWFCSSRSAKGEIDRAMKKTPPSDESLQVDSSAIRLTSPDNVKTLGVCWNPSSDTIHFQVKDIELKTISKRSVLSKLSMLYDPLGLVSVVTIRARVAMQSIWRLREFEWDDPLPDEMCEQWLRLFSELKKLEVVQFPRCVKPDSAIGPPELHVFADASGTAYGAVAYMVSNSTDGTCVRLVASKARVAPLRQTTIPRLELMAALLASRLAQTLSDEFRVALRVTLWTDSQIVLHWICSDSLALKPFVGVRVSEIQSTWSAEHWKFVPTKLNPADDLSRGIDVSEITGRWMKGPDFLTGPKEQWPEQVYKAAVETDEERKPLKYVHATVKITPPIDSSKFSSWLKLLRVTAYCFRFIHNLKCRASKATPRVNDTLQTEEVKEAETYWIRHAQEDLGNWSERYRDLAPFEEDGLVKVGGTLRRSNLPYEQAHPVLLPASHHLSKLILQKIHAHSGHHGCERTLCDSRRKFWVVKGRSLVREIVRKCVVCQKLRSRSHSTLMADLPPQRLQVFSTPFSTTGIDLFGPFNLKFGRNKSQKAWGALFTCATIRAIHLEIVASLSTESFLHALRRFAATHGWPESVISDNGTSFVGAQKELNSLLREGRKQLEDFALLHKVKWIFITPLSPHQGGFYESMVKQAKRAIQVSIGQQTLTWNEMSTVFAEVKCLVNSRPLGYASNDPNDPQPLTPNHFIFGRASPEIPQGPFTETKDLRKRFQFVQALVNRFWERFVSEYIPTLNRRSKWQHMGRQLQVNDIVLLVEYNVPRGKWNLARFIEVFPGQDNVVRNVKVQSKSGVYKRSVQKCCLILEADQGDSVSSVGPPRIVA